MIYLLSGQASHSCITLLALQKQSRADAQYGIWQRSVKVDLHSYVSVKFVIRMTPTHIPFPSHSVPCLLLLLLSLLLLLVEQICLAENLPTEGGRCERTEAGFRTPGARNKKEEENESGTERSNRQRGRKRDEIFLKLLLSHDETAVA